MKIELLSKAPLRPGDGLAEPEFYLAFNTIISFKNVFDDHNNTFSFVKRNPVTHTGTDPGTLDVIQVAR